jgi:murein DD-endopeptidase MepM/ murein hydrolase activator NlpD
VVQFGVPNMRSRILITIGREASESPFRVRLRLRILVGAALLLIGSPIALVVGTTWGARVLIGDLLRQNATLQMENASYREATTELVAQVSALQTAADDLGAKAAVDAETAHAMTRLPSSITHRAMGGSPSLADAASPLSTVASTADPAFGLLRDVLHLVERRLDQARAGVDKRAALAAATPSIWPVPGWLSSNFGSRKDPFSGSPEFHGGIDISADQGQAVRATADGSVTVARYSGNFGNMVVLEHGFGIGTRYGHLSAFAVAEGQQVRKGDVLGYVGSTGRSTSPHLHYEVLLNSRPTNPLRLLGR